MRKQLIVIYCLLLSVPLLAQESAVLKGKVVADSLDGAFINIVNITQETGTVNAPTGEFEIEVFHKDTLIFSSVQYEVREITITEQILDSGYLEVELSENVNELQEVEISDLELTGNLNADIVAIPVFNQADVGISFSKKAKPTSVERKLATATDGGAPLDVLLNTLNGKIKMLKKAKANNDLERLVQRGIEALPHTVFVDEFSIPEEQIKNFVYFCSEDDDFKNLLDSNRPLELLEWYRAKANYFIKYRLDL